jgi:type III pantothenate kinase
LGQVLELDVGNTAIKWRCLAMGGAVLNSGRLVGDVQGVDELLLPDINLVRIASVAHSDREEQLKSLLVSSGVKYLVATSQVECAGLRSAYEDASKLGVDRWLAMVAAFKECRGACVVIDAGTALTIDVVDAHGQHQGGYILPGAELLLKVLNDGTGKVRFGQESARTIAPGINTDTCVHNGKWLSLLGAVWLALKEADLIIGGRYDVFITGGDGLALKELGGAAAESWRFSESLVLDGLAPVLTKA